MTMFVAGSRDRKSAGSGWVAVVVAAVGVVFASRMRRRTATDRRTTGAAASSAISAYVGQSIRCSQLAPLPARSAVVNTRLPDPAGQRLRVGARQSAAGSAGRRRLGPRRRRRSQCHVEHRPRRGTTASVPPALRSANTATTNCANHCTDDFAGVQVGADIARLNWNGWNVHLGTTAGYLGSKDNDNQRLQQQHSRCRSSALTWSRPRAGSSPT